MLLEIVINLFAFISFGTLLAGIIISSIKTPIIMSILWGCWFISTILFMLFANAFSENISQVVPVLQSPQQPIRDIPMQTVVVQHPDGTLSLDSKQNP